MNLSYHDVVVYADGNRYDMSTASHQMLLTCTRSGGWELWQKRDTDADFMLIAGEFSSEDFRIEVADIRICGKPPNLIDG